MKNNQGHGIHYGFVILFCCCLMMGINVGIAFSCAGIFYEPVSESIGVSIGQFGIYMSIMYVASSLLLPAAGKMMERFSARKLIGGASAVMGLTLVGMSFSNRLFEFYVAGAILGFTMAFLLYLGFPTLINRWFNAKVGLMIGICSAASGIGGILFNPLGAYMITTLGWENAYRIFAAIVLLLETPLLFLLLRDRPADKGLLPFGAKEDKGEKTAVTGIAYRDSLRMPSLYALIVLAFLLMATSTLNLFIPKYVTGLDFSLEQASYAAAAVMTGVTLGKLALGQINDWSCMAGVLATTLGGALGLLLIMLGGSSLWLIILGSFRLGVFRRHGADRHAHSHCFRQSRLSPNLFARIYSACSRRRLGFRSMGLHNRADIVRLHLYNWNRDDGGQSRYRCCGAAQGFKSLALSLGLAVNAAFCSVP